MSNKNTLSRRAADNLRVLIVAMVERANSGHPGGAMGVADFLHILYNEYLVFDPDRPEWIARDRFFLDPGHMSPMLYGVLSMYHKYSMEDLMNFRRYKSCTPGHPELDVKRGVENTSGPLGQGHTMAVGAAIAAKKMAAHFGGEELMRQKIYTVISDGGIQEEIAQGAGRIAGHLGLDNLIMFYDANDVQLSTRVSEVTSEDVRMKYEAWQWHVIEIPGNDHNAIRKALDEAQNIKGKPTLIIGNTRMGLGARGAEGESYEDLVSTHGQPLSGAGASPEKTIENLGGNPEDPFKVWDDVQKLYDDRAAELRQMATDWKAQYDAWAKANSADAEELKRWIALDTSHLEWDKIEQKDNNATRGASQTVLSYLADEMPNMIVSSADLCNSDKTDGYLKKTKVLTRDDFTGKFLQPGVSELAMASICVGIALHGGFHAACGTFFVFSDYMKPVIRIAALMEVPVRFIWTHDAFRVGEDGPTHQPVEHEAQIRLMEKLHNHSGNPSMLVLRPADVHEGTVAWQMAMENKSTPTGLVLSRQNIENLPGSSYEQAQQVRKGGYIVTKVDNPDVVLVATGSEVSTLVGAAKLLEEKGVKANIVSVPSEGVFRQQSAEYQAEVLPVGVPRFGLTAGLSVNLAGLVPEGTGKIFGMNHFGESANYNVLDEEFGFTAENIAKEIEEIL